MNDITQKSAPDATTLIVEDDKDHLYAEAVEKILIGFGHGNLDEVRNGMNLLGQGPDMAKLQARLGTMVQEFHTTITNVKLGLDPESISMSSTNIPDAAKKLDYVLSATSESTHRLLGLIERQERYLADSDAAVNSLKEAIANGTPAEEAFKKYEDGYLSWSASFKETLSEAVMTQEFQDLCGQALKKVQKLVAGLEGTLSSLLKHLRVEINPSTAPTPDETAMAQDSVDDLLKDLGF
jgi:chemotaxis protein CheZ